MKRLFYLLLALPMLMVACEKDPEPQPEPTPDINDPVLTLTSDATLEFTAEGGNGTITYTLENADEQTKLIAECDDEWVSDIVVAEDITFVVAANDGDARETKVKVAYGSLGFEVAVKQAAKGEVPTPTDEVVFEASMLVGQYYGDYYTPDAGNYFIHFTDNGFSEDGYALPNSVYYQLDLYGVLYEGEAVNGYIPLPSGTYTFDPEDSMAMGTIGFRYSKLIKIDDSGGAEELTFEAAELVIAEDGSCVLNATIGGVKHKVTFDGESQITDNRIPSSGGEDVNFEANHAYAYYYGDQYAPGVADNFYFFLSDLGADNDGYELPNGTYYRLDLYSNIVDAEGDLAIPYGTYTIDNGSCEPFTISMSNSSYFVMDNEGWDCEVLLTLDSGTVVISESGVTAELMIAGAKHTLTYTGAITPIFDYSGSDSGGDDEEGPYSTLTDDYVCNLNDHTLYHQYYGDYYEVGYMNWTFAIMPNASVGDFVQFDVVADADSTTSFFGDYTVSNALNQYTAYPGYLDYWDGYMGGSWYYTDDGVTMSPFVEGTMSVKDNGDGTVTVEFDVYDDCGFNLTGSWTGEMKSATELNTRSGNVKKGNKVQTKSVNIPLKSASKAQKSDISKF